MLTIASTGGPTAVAKVRRPAFGARSQRTAVVVVPGDEVWRRIVGRDLEGRWKPRLITREELEEWSRTYDRPTDEEMSAYDSPG